MNNETIKAKTLELYAQLPQDKQQRMARTDIRDKVIELNYSFFGYVAAKTFINNQSVTYEDKLQSALLHFCESWWWYKWQGDKTHKGYRTDLSFSVFFAPRIGEMIERELNEVKYSIRRALCMKVGDQLGKHWGHVRYDDLTDPRLHLSVNDMNSLKAIFGSLYLADLEEHEQYIAAPPDNISEFENLSDKYDSIDELLIHEMVERESKLSDRDLAEIANMLSLDYYILKEALPDAEAELYKRLKINLQIKEN